MSFSGSIADSGGAPDALTFAFTSPEVPGNADGFPPPGPTVLGTIIPAYLYEQYQDDEDLQALIVALNSIMQDYLSWFVTVGLPIYTGLTGPLLDWVATNLYGQPRPQLSYGTLEEIGPLNTWTPNEIEPNGDHLVGSPVLFPVSDDFYKRVLTWNFFKGDGRTFSVRWLKRRIYRFLYGIDGSNPSVIGPTYQISVTFGVGNQINVRILLAEIDVTLSATPNEFALNEVTPNECDFTVVPLPPVPFATVLQSLFDEGWLELPFPFTFTFTIETGAPLVNYLYNNSGVLMVMDAALYPTSAAGLDPGSIWSNGGTVEVVPGTTADPTSAPTYFPPVTDSALLAMGGSSLLTTTGPVGSTRLWNNNNVVNVS